MDQGANTQQPHVAIVPSLGIGHLIPLLELGKVLVSRFDFSATLFLFEQPRQSSILTSLPKGISYVFISPPNATNDPSSLQESIAQSFTDSLSSIRTALLGLKEKATKVFLITDLFGTDLFDVSRDLGIPPYIFCTMSATALLFGYYFRKLDQTVSCEYRDLAEPIIMPGCVPVYGKDFPDAAEDRKSEAYRIMLHIMKGFTLADGIFVNSFVDLELGALHDFQTKPSYWPPVYPIGPIISTSLIEAEDDGSECLSWLDRQPTGSVLYVSFGSGGTLTSEQFNELAVGLEKSGVRFLWVIRRPNDETSSGSYFSAQPEIDPLSFLPNGYLDRVGDRGLFVPSWAPQIKVLQHKSTGGFLTHCGWNSFLESLSCEVPLIVWPLYAEQKMNALMLHEGLKVALRPMANEHGLIVADEVAKAVENLINGEDGERLRLRMIELNNLAKNAIAQDGASTKFLCEVAAKWASM